MAQTPNVIGLAVMQRLKEVGAPATPENYERAYYEISGLPVPEKPTTAAEPSPACLELLAMVREMVAQVTDQTDTLAKNLGEKNRDLAGNVHHLKSSRDKNEILRLLSTVVMQAGGIQSTVEASHRELLETRRSLTAMQTELAETRQMLNEDALTGALNRRGLDQTLEREVARAQRNQTRLSLAMLDLDHFKKLNDTYGHEAGDRMLVHFAALTKSVLRKSDAFVRYGGEEFVVLLPDTDARGALFVLGRLQQLMAKTPLMHEHARISATFSAGIATLRAEENGHALLRRADEALYQAKHGGRNLIKIAG